MTRLAFVVALAAAGCIQHPICDQPVAGIAAIEYRDPATGACQSFGSCDNACGPCPAYAGLQPDWGVCYGSCSGLTESQCLASTSCHAAYSDDPTPQPVFWGCWDLPPSGAVTGACDGLDAQTCSEHTDCASLYTGPVNQPQNFVPSFEKCIAKPGALPACATLTTESACTSRSDCDAVYTGTNCTCDKNGCTCQSETFLRCQ